MTTQTNTTLVEEAVERLKIAFWASLTNANAGMKWLDHDSMEEMISAAWAGFEEPAMSALLASLPTDDDDTVERVALALAEAGHAAISYRAGASVDYWDRLARAAIHTLIGRDK